MSISQRIALLVFFAFVAITTTGGFAIFQSSLNAQHVKSVTENSVPSTLASADLLTQLKDTQLSAMTYITAPDESISTPAKNDLNLKRSTLKKAVLTQLQQAATTRQRLLAKEALTDLSDYFSALDETINFKNQGRADVATADFFANVVQYQMVLEQIVDTLRIEKNRFNTQAIVTLNHNLKITVSTVSVITTCSLLILAFAGILLYRQIVRPLMQMRLLMHEIAVEQDFSRRVPVLRQDEIGHSVTAFNLMMAKTEATAKMLREKTVDIQSMLHHIPLGIMMIGAQGDIHPEYSEHLESILETPHIAEQNVIETLFNRTDASGDMISIISTTIATCIGEHSLNYEMNAHQLPREMKLGIQDHHKILDLIWSPIIDENDTVVRLLLCLRDVTIVHQLTQQAHEQSQELSMIGEILGVTWEKFHDFIESSRTMIQECNHLNSINSIDTSAALLRNLHTIKGNARTLGLLFLTNTVHEAEHQLTAAVYRQELEGASVAATAEVHLKTVLHIIEQYASINDLTLGRKGAGRRRNTDRDRYLMIDKQHIQAILHPLNEIDYTRNDTLPQTLQWVQHKLNILDTQSLKSVLSGISDSLPALAAELGKMPPELHIEDAGYLIRNPISDLLKNIFVHLMRNSLDHGIESAEVRTALGKPPQGTMRLSAKVQNAHYVLHFSDDGQGLVLERIRKTAVERGLILESDQLSDQEIGELIFRSGFSTASTVTKISGRGIGMDAVRNFIHQENGSISIEFLDKETGQASRHFQLTITLPEKWVVAQEPRAFVVTHNQSPRYETLV